MIQLTVYRIRHYHPHAPNMKVVRHYETRAQATAEWDAAPREHDVCMEMLSACTPSGLLDNPRVDCLCARGPIRT